MALWRLYPGTTLTVTPNQSEYDIGDAIYADVEFTVEGQGVIGPAFTMYCDVYVFGKQFRSGGDQKAGIGYVTASTDLRVPLGKAITAGTFDGYVVARAHDGI